LNHFSTVFSFFSTFVSDSGFLEHSKLSQYVTGLLTQKQKNEACRISSVGSRRTRRR
jgi:hypothetical protein